MEKSFKLFKKIRKLFLSIDDATLQLPERNWTIRYWKLVESELAELRILFFKDAMIDPKFPKQMILGNLKPLLLLNVI